jgi:hypothetical protein
MRRRITMKTKDEKIKELSEKMDLIVAMVNEVAKEVVEEQLGNSPAGLLVGLFCGLLSLYARRELGNLQTLGAIMLEMDKSDNSDEDAFAEVFNVSLN